MYWKQDKYVVHLLREAYFPWKEIVATDYVVQPEPVE